MKKLTKAQEYIKENLGNTNTFNDVQVFSVKFPDEFLEVKEYIENNCIDNSVFFDAMMDETWLRYTVEKCTETTLRFNEFVEYELAIIEDIEELNEIESSKETCDVEAFKRYRGLT